MTKVSTERKFTVQLSLQELDVIAQYLLKPSNKEPWLEMANKLGRRAETWRAILRKENHD